MRAEQAAPIFFELEMTGRGGAMQSIAQQRLAIPGTGPLNCDAAGPAGGTADAHCNGSADELCAALRCLAITSRGVEQRLRGRLG